MTACETATSNPKSTAATWTQALVGIPADMTTDGSWCFGTFALKRTQACLEKIKTGETFPLVLFLHGCAGLKSGSQGVVSTLRTVGYATLAPDSFARPGRKKNCSGFKGRILYLRQLEIAHALTGISDLDWVDTSRLVLAGFSEGAQATAGYSGEDAFQGYIMLGFDCTRGVGHGVRMDRPVLIIQGSRDSWAKGSCTRALSDHSANITVPGARHDVSGFPETKQALAAFLAAVAPKN